MNKAGALVLLALTACTVEGREAAEPPGTTIELTAETFLPPETSQAPETTTTTTPPTTVATTVISGPLVTIAAPGVDFEAEVLVPEEQTFLLMLGSMHEHFTSNDSRYLSRAESTCFDIQLGDASAPRTAERFSGGVVTLTEAEGQYVLDLVRTHLCPL